MADSLKHKILSGVFWQGLERIGNQGISFVISIVLARLLVPEEFGVIAIMMVLTSLCGCFIDSGFGSALIQKKDADDVDFSTVFFINITMAVILYGVMFAVSPLIADFYRKSEITIYLRWLSLNLIFSSFSGVQGALLSKRMMFNLSFRISWAALIVSGIVGIVMAYCGYGVWALIAQSLTSTLVRSISLWFWVRWIPHCTFDWQRAKSLFSYGWKLFCSGLLDTLYNDIYSILIGRIADLKMLSFYNRGKAIPSLGMGIVNSTIGSVMFPAFSELQNDRDKMKLLAQKGLQNIMFCVIPILTLLFILANPLIRLLLTDKWLPSVIFVQICCVTFFWWPFHTMNLQIINACGRSDYFLILEIIKKVQSAVVILLTYRYGVIAMVSVNAAMGIIDALTNGWPNRWLINYPPWRQMWDILPILLIGCICGTIAYFVSNMVSNIIIQLLIGGATFCLLYLGLTLATKTFPQDMLTSINKVHLGKNWN